MEAFKKESNANSNHSNQIWSIQMQILTIIDKFEAFKCKFELVKRDSKHPNASSNHSKGIQSIRIQILTIWKWLETFERDSNHLETSEIKFEHLKPDSKY